MFFLGRSDSSGLESGDWDGFGRPPGRWYAQHFIMLFIIVAGVIGVMWGFFGRGIAEKMVTALVQPVGLAWVCLSVIVYFCAVLRHAVFLVFGACGWIALTLAGNQYFSNWLASTLESRYYSNDLSQLDAVEYGLLLGGGTVTAPNSREQLNANGDRVVVAAQLYRAGKLKKIICSGSNSVVLSNANSPRDEAATILKRLGVPSGDILTLEGANTFQEIENLQTWISGQVEAGQDPGRVAVISSAWHLPRVQRLARARQVPITPVPTNFLSLEARPSAYAIVPGAYPLFVSSQVAKEYLAGLVKR